MDFDTTVKLKLYEIVAETAQMPSSVDIAVTLGAPVPDVEAAFARLQQKRLLVCEPGDQAHIRMAPPFSGIPTPFLVRVGSNAYYANCVWDALGIPAALHRDGLIIASDAWTNEPIPLEIRNEAPVPQECAIHFAVPAAHWWDDIIYT